MQVIERATILSAILKKEKEASGTIGFVPTMGALHSGHLSLVEHARQENNIVIVSIFVNPTQFNNPEDLQKYPRIIEDDISKLRTLDCDILFLPSVEEMYPFGVETEKLDLNGLDKYMEGLFRPGHFEGVATIVKRFFEIIQPDKAYFGEKDFQQLLIIRHITKTLNLGIEIISHPTERSESGLALSSRNQRLSEDEIETSLIIPRTLLWARENYTKYSPSSLKGAIRERFADESPTLEYIEICDSSNLHPIERWEEAEHVRLFIAAYTGNVRLIDNVSLF